MSLAKQLGIRKTDLADFCARYGVDEQDFDGLTADEQRAARIAVVEWSHQRWVGARARNGYSVMQFAAPVAAATATVFAAFTSTKAWAVIPAAVATVAASLLAAFGFRETWLVRKRLRHELSHEIVCFITNSGNYRDLDRNAQIDRLMKRVGKVSEESVGE